MAEVTQELSKVIKFKFFKEDNIKGLMRRVEDEIDSASIFAVDAECPRCGARGEDVPPKTKKGYTLIDGEVEITIRKF